MDLERKCLAFSIFEHISNFYGNKICFSRKANEYFSVKEKAHLDLVSNVDTEIENLVWLEINSRFPKDGVLFEESPEFKSHSRYRWIVDPIDGTHNFLAGFKEFGTSLALEEDGMVVFGMFYFPQLKELFVAEKNLGAFCNGEKIKVSKATDFSGEMFCSDGIMRKKPKEILKDIERFCAANCRVRIYGSSPYAMTRVALGQAIVATNRAGKPWDIAAAALLVEEAGGKVTDENGKPWSVDSENIIATNGILHQRALELFN